MISAANLLRMDHMKLAEYVREHPELITSVQNAKGLNDKDLSIALNVTDTSVWRWRTGRVKPATGPALTFVLEYGEVLRNFLPPDWEGNSKRVEVTDQGDRKMGVQILEVNSVPLLGTLPATRLDLQHREGSKMIPVPVGEGLASQLFAVQVSDDSMTCASKESVPCDTIVIMHRKDWNDNDIVAVNVGDECLCRKIARFGDSVILQPLNPAFKTVMANIQDIEVLGVIRFTMTER